MQVAVTFAEHSPPFILSMQRLRCQAKVKTKTLKLHMPGCCICAVVLDIMLAVGVLKNQMNSGKLKNVAT